MKTKLSEHYYSLGHFFVPKEKNILLGKFYYRIDSKNFIYVFKGDKTPTNLEKYKSNTSYLYYSLKENSEDFTIRKLIKTDKQFKELLIKACYKDGDENFPIYTSGSILGIDEKLLGEKLIFISDIFKIHTEVYPSCCGARQISIILNKGHIEEKRYLISNSSFIHNPIISFALPYNIVNFINIETETDKELVNFLISNFSTEKNKFIILDKEDFDNELVVTILKERFEIKK